MAKNKYAYSHTMRDVDDWWEHSGLAGILTWAVEIRRDGPSNQGTYATIVLYPLGSNPSDRCASSYRGPMDLRHADRIPGQLLHLLYLAVEDRKSARNAWLWTERERATTIVAGA